MGAACGAAASAGAAGASATLGEVFLPARVTSETRERPTRGAGARTTAGDVVVEGQREEPASARAGAVTAATPTADMADIVPVVV